METRGAWGVCVRVAGAVKETVERDALRFPAVVRFHGYRSGADVREDGYALRCRVSIGGRKVPAFTSSAMLEITDPQPGDCRLVEVATLHV